MRHHSSYLVLIMITAFVIGCDSTGDPVSPEDQLDNATIQELNKVKSATAKYSNIGIAIYDGYVNANEYVAHMGDHYINMDLLTDGKFEVEKPELLVFAPDSYGRNRLVAVEYGVLLSDYPDGPPEGFTGNKDIWLRDEVHGLWTLHVWIWYNNPDGMFEPFNSRVD